MKKLALATLIAASSIASVQAGGLDPHETHLSFTKEVKASCGIQVLDDSGSLMFGEQHVGQLTDIIVYTNAPAGATVTITDLMNNTDGGSELENLKIVDAEFNTVETIEGVMDQSPIQVAAHADNTDAQPAEYIVNAVLEISCD